MRIITTDNDYILYDEEGVYLSSEEALEFAKQLPEVAALVEACEASIRYDAAIQSCADDPDKMSSYCAAAGDDLDTLYGDWLSKSRSALHPFQEADDGD